MANTSTLDKTESKKNKRAARKKNKELYASLSRADRKRFNTQIHDKKAKSKQGIVAFSQGLKKAEE